MTIAAGEGPHAAAQSNAAALRRIAVWEKFNLVMLSAPGLALVVLLLLVPVLWLSWLSFFDAAGNPSLENYERMLRPVYQKTFFTTFQIAGIVSFFCVVLGYPVAYLLSQVPERVANVLLVFVILPFWTSILVRTYAWLVILQRKGLINDWLLSLGLIDDALPLVHNKLGTIIGMVHIMLPFLILPLYASMRAIDPVLLRAAANCGASPSRAFYEVFLPLSLPGLAAGVGLVFVLCLGFFVTPALLGGGRVGMWAMQIADNISLYGNWGAASALGVILLVVTFAILWLLRMATKTGLGGETS